VAGFAIALGAGAVGSVAAVLALHAVQQIVDMVTPRAGNEHRALLGLVAKGNFRCGGEVIGVEGLLIFPVDFAAGGTSVVAKQLRDH